MWMFSLPCTGRCGAGGWGCGRVAKNAMRNYTLFLCPCQEPHFFTSCTQNLLWHERAEYEVCEWNRDVEVPSPHEREVMMSRVVFREFVDER